MKEIFFLNGIRAGKTEIAESFRRYGTVAFSTRIMMMSIKAKEKLDIEEWLELVPPEYQTVISEIITEIKPQAIAKKCLLELKCAFIREVQNLLEEKVKSGRCLISTLPDLGCPN